jgi:hypothetical protein
MYPDVRGPENPGKPPQLSTPTQVALLARPGSPGVQVRTEAPTQLGNKTPGRHWHYVCER